MKPGDAAAMAAAVAGVLGDPAGAASMVAEARTAAARFSVSAHVEAVVALYGELLSG